MFIGSFNSWGEDILPDPDLNQPFLPKAPISISEKLYFKITTCVLGMLITTGEFPQCREFMNS
jgi:hypothetical protein